MSKKRVVVYQIYPRSFADSNGDGVGDLRGITNKLDYLAELGVDVVWLSPIYRSPQDDNGYDISDYQDIDPLFGTLAEWDALVAGLHARGMRLMMDLVVNHTSDEHPWFVESRSSRDNPKRDWYWWRDPRAGQEPGAVGAEPTNWESFFSGPAWDFDESTGQYYLHLFSRKQPDLNWENPEVRTAVFEMMRWWLDRGVDGFRMDVINMISKRDPLGDGVIPPGGRYGFGWPWFINGPRVHEFLSEMHRKVFAGHSGLLTVGETPGVDPATAALYTDPERGELDMVFQFEHMSLDYGRSKWEQRPIRLTALKATLARWQDGLAQVGWNSLYWSNHDQPRAVSRFGDPSEHRVDSAKVLATVLHLQRGTPFIYQGEELGMTNTVFAGIEDFRDLESINHFREATASGADPEDVLRGLRPMSRDNARTPMQWTAGEHAGFTAGTPWIALNPNAVEINAAAAVADPESVFHHYRRLIALRHELPVVADGSFEMLLADHESIFAFVRRLDGRELLVLGNFSATDQPVDFPGVSDWTAGQVLLRSGGQADETDGHLCLGPWESRVLLLDLSAHH